MRPGHDRGASSSIINAGSDEASEPTIARPRIAIGLIAAPGLAEKLAGGLSETLRDRLAQLYSDVDWEVPVVIDGMVTPSAPATELIDPAHRRLLREDWELAVCLTDVPLRIGLRTLAGHASPTHRIALVSVPALGRPGCRLASSTP